MNNTPYRQLLDQIAEQARKYGDELQSPCRPEKLADLQLRAMAQLGCNIPPGYVEFLLQHDGFDWDGLVFYAGETSPIVGHEDRFIEGFVEANMGFRDDERMKQFLVLGDSGMDLYVYAPAKNEYSARDRISLDLNEPYPSFEDLLAAALRTRV